MDKPDPDVEPEDTHIDESGGDDEPWWTQFPHTTVRAVPATEGMAGVDVSIVDLEEMDEPPILVFQEFYPLDHEPDGDVITIQGPGEALELVTTILQLLGSEFAIPAVEEDDLDDDEWQPTTDVSTGGER